MTGFRAHFRQDLGDAKQKNIQEREHVFKNYFSNSNQIIFSISITKRLTWNYHELFSSMTACIKCVKSWSCMVVCYQQSSEQ